MSMELLFAPTFLFNGEITAQDSIVLITEFSVNAPGQPGRTAEFQATATHLQWRLLGDPDWINLLALSVLEGEPGEDGVPAEFQASATHLQWRLVGSVIWLDLLPLSILEGDPGNDGREVQFQVTATHIQWKYNTDLTWTNLIALSELQGEPGDDSPPVVPVAGDGIDIDDTDPLAPIISATFSGSYTDLTDKPSIPDDPADIGAATAAQGGLADSAVQPGDLATVATTGQYNDLLGKPSIPDDPADIGAATAAQGALADAALQPSDIGTSVAGLVAGLVPSNQLPSYVDDVLEYADFASLPVTGETGKIYILATPYTSGGITSSQFRWSGSLYAPIIASPGSTDAVTEGSTNLYFLGSRVLATVLTGFSTASAAVVSAADSVLSALGKLQAQITALASSVSNVDNTSDVNKPVSTAQQTALDLKANAANPAFTGTATGLTKSMVGLSNVDNTADSAKPVSTAQQTAIDLKMANPMTTSGDLIYGGASGVATRLPKGTNGQIAAMVSNLPAWIDSPYVLQTTYDDDMGDIAAALAAILG